MGSYQSSNSSVVEAADRVHSLISATKLARRVKELGQEISADYADQHVLVVGILHGAYVFMADLVRQLTIPVRCGFVMVSTYGDDTVTTGRVKLHLDLVQPIEGRHVLLLDDIVDTGVSTSWLIDHLTEGNPASLRLCALLNKTARRRVPVKIDYVGFEVPDRFVVGYGIDHAGRHRELPYVGYVSADEGP